jgi:nicotinamidase-related amidase
MIDRPLLVCLDLQRIFLADGPLLAPNAGDALIASRRLLSAARERNWRVAHCYLSRREGPLQVLGNAARPVDGFEPLRNETVLKRETLSAYGHAAFGSWIKETVSFGVILTGLSASLTLSATMFDAFERGHQLVIAPRALAAQAGAAADAQAHRQVACDVAGILGFALISSSDLPTQPILSIA